MSDFLKFAWEVLSAVVYNLSELFWAFVKLFITGWVDYFNIFKTYFADMNIIAKILSILLLLILVAIPIVIIIIIVRRIILNIRLKADHEDNAILYKEIGRLNRQVLNLMDEKNKILALKVNHMGGREKIPYMGASALTNDVIPSVENVSGGEGGTGLITGEGLPVGEDGIPVIKTDITESAINNTAEAIARARQKAEEVEKAKSNRFPRLSLIDLKYAEYVHPEYDHEINLQDFTERFRLFACANMHLYYTPEIIRRFIAGMASSKILILEGISGTGKTSLPYAFSRYLDNPCTMVSVQPSFRDRTELLGYFNEFSKRFNETEFLAALYEAGYRDDPSLIVLDEMNLARIEYYFAEMLSILEMPSRDEWIIDLVPTEWDGDPKHVNGGKMKVSPNIWFVGTANNDDSTFTITDKVYDRAIPIELNQRADAFICEEQEHCHIAFDHLEKLFEQAKIDHPISDVTISRMDKLDSYLQTRFKLAFGNRIIKQMYEFIPVYVACGGTELDGLDYIIARKVLKKFESLNISFVRDEIKGLITYIEKTFGKAHMPDSKDYLTRIQNLY